MENDKYENLNSDDDIFDHERQDEGEPTPEELQERADGAKEALAESFPTVFRHGAKSIRKLL